MRDWWVESGSLDAESIYFFLAFLVQQHGIAGGEHCAASHKIKAPDGDNYCVGWLRNSPLLARKEERSGPIAYQSVLDPEKTKFTASESV